MRLVKGGVSGEALIQGRGRGGEREEDGEGRKKGMAGGGLGLVCRRVGEVEVGGRVMLIGMGGD